MIIPSVTDKDTIFFTCTSVDNHLHISIEQTSHMTVYPIHPI
jgi:hypothetical protein